MSEALLYFLLGLVFVIPLNIISNIFNRKYDDAMAKRSVAVKEQQLKELKREYAFIKSLKDDQFYAAVTIARWIVALSGTIVGLVTIFWALTLFAIYLPSAFPVLSSSSWIAIVIIAMTVFVYLFIWRRLERYSGYLKNLAYFALYRRRVFEQVEKLGGNVEELEEKDSPPF
jgi:hypothetical protein